MDSKTIAVISGKGGVGKTTLCANLGTVMAEVLEMDVLMVDTDISSSHLGMHMGLHYNPATVNSVLDEDHGPQESIYEHETGTKVVPGALNYDDVKDVDVHQIESIIEEYRDQADIVLLDCSPGLDRETSAAVRACDSALYVSRPSFTSIVDVMRTQSLVEELGRDSMGIVLNMVKGHSHEISKDDVESFTEMEVRASIPYDTKVEESAAQGAPVTVYEPHTQASRAIERLAIDMAGKDGSYERQGVERRLRELFPGL